MKKNAIKEGFKMKYLLLLIANQLFCSCGQDTSTTIEENSSMNPLSIVGPCSNSIVYGKWKSSITGMDMTFTADCRYINEFCQSTGSYPSNVMSNQGSVLISVDSRGNSAPSYCLPLGISPCQYQLDKSSTPNKLAVTCGNVGSVYIKQNSSTTSLITSYGSTATNGNVEQVKTQFPCQRRSDVSFNTSSQGQSTGTNKTTITGPFQIGALAGTFSGVFVGATFYKDLIIVSKVTNGSQVIGHNVTLSYCISSPLITEQRDLSNFNAPYGITLSTSTNCSLGNVDAANQTSTTSAAYQSYPAGNVISSFSKYCN
jgi:hypothetical protein